MADRRRGSANAYDIKPAQNDEYIKRTEPSHSAANIHASRSKTTYFSYGKFAVVSLFAFAVFFLILQGKADVTELTNKINAEQQNVQVLKDENSRMKAEIQSKNSQKAVEEYAENILGMQKIEKSQCEYISLESGNVIEIADNSDNVLVKFKNRFSEFIDYIRG